MKYNISEIQEMNRQLTIKLHDVFVDKKVYEIIAEGKDFRTNRIDRKKHPPDFIYLDDVMLKYCYNSSLFFNNLYDVLDSKKFKPFEEKERYSQNLFEQHLISFLIVLKRVTKPENINLQNNQSFLQIFVDNDWGLYIKRDYVIEKIIRLFNNDEKLREFIVIQPFLKNTTQKEQDFDSNIFKTKEASNLFYEYIQKYCIDVYTDISFIFQKMLDEKLIYKTTHKEFMGWLKRENLIKEKDYNEMYEKGFFKSKYKSFSQIRLNHYFKLIERHINS